MFVSSWYSVAGVQWCNINGENTSDTSVFEDGETAYMLVHLLANNSKYYWYNYRQIFILANGGICESVSDKTTADKLDVVISVKTAAPEESFGDITINLSDEGTTLSGYELEAVTSTINELGKQGVLTLPDYQAYDLDNDGNMDVYLDNMTVADELFSRFYAAGSCSIEDGFTLEIPESIKQYLLSRGYAYCDCIIFNYEGGHSETCPKGGNHDVSLANADGPISKEYYTLSYSNNVNAGTASVKITLQGEWYTGSKTVTYKIEKAAKKYFTINAKSGKVTIKKGLKKGTYKLKVSVNALGNRNYTESSAKTVVTIKVK